MEKHAFVIEDEDNIRELIKCTLESCGLAVQSFENAPRMLREISQAAALPDVILLDVMLPEMDGMEALRRLKADRRAREVPVILLTAKSGELDKVNGLDLGAEDYVTKPFGVLELMARVRAVLRRGTHPQEPGGVLTRGALTLDVGRHEVTLGGEKIELTLKEFDLLRTLMENAGRAMARNELLDKVWGYGYAGETRTLDMHIRSLRMKLHEGADTGGFISTVRGVGYRFNE